MFVLLVLLQHMALLRPFRLPTLLSANTCSGVFLYCALQALAGWLLLHSRVRRLCNEWLMQCTPPTEVALGWRLLLSTYTCFAVSTVRCRHWQAGCCCAVA
jgi:hypothetical protein